MKRQRAALAMAMAVVLMAVTASLAGKVLFEDKFTALDPAWGAAGPIMDVKDGKLIITPEMNTTQTVLNQANVFPNDAEGSFAMTFVKAPAPNWGSGLVFWARDYNEYYAVLINPEGWFAVQRYVAGRYLLPVAWRESDAIKQGHAAEPQVKGKAEEKPVQGQQLCPATPGAAVCQVKIECPPIQAPGQTVCKATIDCPPAKKPVKVKKKTTPE